MRARTSIAAAAVWLALVAARPALAFVVDDIGDAADVCFDGLCAVGTTCNGPCTFRAALEEANRAGGGTVTFAIGSGPQTIQPTAPLPPVGANVVIDGLSQPAPPGWPPCTPLIEIDGSAVTPGANGLILPGGNATVRGLVINRFRADASCIGGAGIFVSSDFNTIQCNFIGTDASGTLAAGGGGTPVFGNQGGGVWIVDADENLVGGLATERNVISANGPPASGCPNQGVAIDGNNPSLGTGNTIAGNLIGTDVTGAAPLGNGVNGCIIHESVNNVVSGNVISGNGDEGVDIVGGSTAGLASGNQVTGNFIGTNRDGTAAIPNNQGVRIAEADGNTLIGNVISGNTADGVVIGEGGGNFVLGNRIGTGADGVAPLPNGVHGVRIFRSVNNLVGGTAGVTAAGLCTGDCNVIAYNNGVGVLLNLGAAGISSPGNAIRANSIFRNGPSFSGLGIDIGPANPNANDPGDADVGGNDKQNFPDLTFGVATTGGILVFGTLDSTPGRLFAVDVFANDACDPWGYGEGGTWLGTTTVATPAAGGPVPFTITVPPSPVFPGGSVLTATATDLTTNDTSEFSPCLVVPLDHFSCHKTFEYPSPSFAGFANLPLTDRFLSRTANANRVLGLCAPADKNGEDPTAPLHPVHLEGYKLRRTYTPTDPSWVDLILKDQFGTLLASVYVPKAYYLLTPTAKSLLPVSPVVPDPGVVDDFLCYPMRQYPSGVFPQVAAPLSVTDQFGPEAFTWRRAKWFCTPVSVNLDNPTAPRHLDQLTCYKVPAQQATNWNVDVWVGNRFGVEALRVQRQNLLCVPSRIGCVGTCVGGTAPGQPCADDTHCPGLGTCDVPPCCCAPDGASQCTSDAECPGSWCECP